MVTYFKLGDILPSLWTMQVIKIEGRGECILYVGLAYNIRYDMGDCNVVSLFLVSG